jgi:hypothetical protein
MKLRNKFIRVVNVYDTRPYFDKEELDSIGHFIISQHIDSNIQQVNGAPVQLKQIQPIPNTPELKPELQPALAPTNHLAQSNGASVATLAPLVPVNTLAPDQHSILSCKYCGGSTQYTPMYGKFGYYINCNQCSKNTSMKQA